jgi:DNA-binding NarL/FixJ family response regulator
MAMYTSSGILLCAENEFTALLAEQWPHSAPERLPLVVADALLVQRQQFCLGERILVYLSQRVGDVVYLKVRPRQRIDGLTGRELQVARLVACGMSFKEVAATLRLAPATVRNHIQHIHERLEIHTNAELASLLACALP